MALLKSSCGRMGTALRYLNSRSYAMQAKLESNIKKSVYISQSTDIYTNLALEEWLYKNFDFHNNHILLLWQNSPSVVIGRQQNPWLETNFSDLRNLLETGVTLARRSSKGSASYNDKGSLSLSFFAPSETLNAKHNSEVVARSIFREFGSLVSVGSEDELYLRQNKQMSNKSARVGKENSYHNMSLMVRTDKVSRDMVFQENNVNQKECFQVSANVKNPEVPTSTPKMMNLCEENPEVTVSSLIRAIGWEFLRTKALTFKDGGMEFANHQKGFHLINPTENWFPGLKEIRDAYKSWDWCYGKTPKFDITRSFTVPGVLLHNNSGASGSLNVTMSVENGMISDITIYVPYEFNSFGFTGEAKVIHSLKGMQFSVQAIRDLEESFYSLLDDKDRFVTECVRQVMTCA
ncbi:lipoyl amidotransferase LIPT1, mitochondrial-like [Euwallacea fornicatus]|uniref:lipoyl amidotransferase LIPT1, mitochondrial-like n=1 Tax=Euwallacea fornicatus TaxID=995702 RepID=UPI00338FB50E